MALIGHFCVFSPSSKTRRIPTCYVTTHITCWYTEPDGYQVYHTVENDREDLKIAGCWSHARRRFDEAVKTLPKAKQKDSRAYLALTMIQAIYREEKLLKDLPAEERKTFRQLSVRPLVEAYFMWVKENIPKVPQKSKTWEGFSYSINQEKYLKVFLDDGEVPMDNNAAEQSIRGFCIGKKNWGMIDTVAGAKSSAIIYSIAETAKANSLKPYDYFEYLLTEIPKHLDDTDRSFLDDLLPWSPNLPAKYRLAPILYRYGLSTVYILSCICILLITYKALPR